MKRILVSGAFGQIGSELTLELRRVYGSGNVVACDIRPECPEDIRQSGPVEQLDCTDRGALAGLVSKYQIDTVYHLPALLSATAEAQPQRAWQLNMGGLCHALEVAREHGCALFVPSSIGAFGPGTPRDLTPQDTIQRPNTMYGVTKVAGELLCDYYHSRFGVDVRGLRYPGIISHKTLPGGGTTDYAVAIYYEAIRKKRFTCFLAAGSYLDMMYMPDALKAAIEVMEADPARLKHRNAFNVTAMSFAPEHISAAIQRHIPDFQMDYQVDPVRQAIADSWPRHMDDAAARQEWGWKPDWDLARMTLDMLRVLGQRYGYPDSFPAA
jgi:nucleoside-diphosphate-sugar epimerase